MKVYTTTSFSVNEKSATSDPIDVRGATIANVDTILMTGTFGSAGVLEVMWRMSVDTPWRSFVPARLLTTATPYTTTPIDVSGVPEIAVRVTTVTGSAGEVIVYVATDEIGR